MIKQEKHIKEVLRLLTILADYLETAGKINLNDGSVISENMCESLMNIVYGYDLKNINLVTQNAAVIDLYDEEGRVAVQVTSNSGLKKMRDCLKGFIDKELYKEYDKLYIYVLTKKQGSYSIDPVSKENFNFNWKTHIIDKSDVIAKLQGLSPNKIEKALKIIEQSIDGKISKTNRSNEVETIINLISLLSNSNGDNKFDEESEIDPKKKIRIRYPENYESIEETYIDLCIQYNEAMDIIEEGNDISSVQHSKVSLYLKTKSRDLLAKYKNDADLAFLSLKSEVIDMFSEENVSYDEMAVQFYLYKQLVACNVFPLPRSRNKCLA